MKKQYTETKYEVLKASAITGTCILHNLTTDEYIRVKLDNWKWRNSFAAEIFFTFRGRKFSVVTDLEASCWW